MTGPAVDSRPVLPSEGEAMAADAQSTAATARRIAHMLAEGVQGEQPAAQNQNVPQDQGATVGVKQDAPVVDPALPPVVAPVVDVAAAEDAPEPVNVTEIDQTLSDAGIDLGMSSADFPPEYAVRYEQIATVALEAQAEVQRATAAAEDANARLQDFSKQLQEAPDRVLLALALQNGEVFQQVSEVVTRMQTDPQFKEIVIRDLQSEARLREADRRDRISANGNRMQRAQRVIAATKKSARAHGVEFALAEQVVALAVQAGNGNLEVNAVDGIVSKLRVGKPVVRPVRVATPQKQAAVAAAPTQAAGAPTAPPVAQNPTSKGLSPTTPYGKLRGIISRALSNQLTTPQ